MIHSETIPSITLGLLSASHLGDALCTTPLPRLLKAEHGREVFITEHPSTLNVFANNPYVAGFVKSPGMPLLPRMRGRGHVIQRLQRGMGLAVSDIPKPEIYLSPQEIEWAQQQKAMWPADRPACIFSTRVLTDMGHFNFRQVHWEVIAEEWARECTIVQPVMTQGHTYQQSVASLPMAMHETWREERVLPGAVVYRDLTLRQYMALFSVAEYFCGGTSGGAHVAAAFDRPALILGWHGLLSALRFPFKGYHLATAAFLYPQHCFLEAERVSGTRVDRAAIVQAIRQVYRAQAVTADAAPVSHARPVNELLAIRYKTARRRHGSVIRIPLRQ